MSAPWGATPEDWADFDLCLGFGSRLLPVVSNPHAEISKQSHLKTLGKAPTRYNAGRKVVGIPGWTTRKVTPQDLAAWSKEPDYGICLRLGYDEVSDSSLVAIDCDKNDATLVDRLHRVIGARIDCLPVRYRDGTARRVFLLRVQGRIKKDALGEDPATGGGDGAIEVLGDGQQVVVAGTHPSGSRYRWGSLVRGDFKREGEPDSAACWGAGLVLLDEGAFAQLKVDIRACAGGEWQSAKGGSAGSRERGADLDIADDRLAWLESNWENYGYGLKGQLHVLCPFKADHSMDSGETECSYFPAGLGGYEQGAWVCQHAHCRERGNAAFDHASGYTAADFEVLPAVVDETAPAEAPRRLVRDGKGAIEPTAHNLNVSLLAPEWTGTDIAYDEFRADVMVSPHGRGQWRPLAEEDYFNLRLWLERKGFKPISKELLRDAVYATAKTRSFDSAKLWLDGLEWDGLPRVSRFLADYFGTEDTPYAAAVSRYWWTAHAGRVLEPGCQADMVPILVGAQGVGKSQALKAMVPALDHYIEVNLEHKDADLSRKMRGALLGELGELRGLQGRSVEANKAWVSAQFEEWTPKYMERAVRLLRRLVFVGTTNRDDFLGDSTGERRWLPIAVGSVDIAAVRRDHVQLWAEAKVLFAASGVAWEGAFELAKEEHDAFKHVDIWQDAVSLWLDSPEGQARGTEGFTLPDVIFCALGGDLSKHNNGTPQRLGNVLTALGCKKQRARVSGKREYLWFRPPVPHCPPRGEIVGDSKKPIENNSLA